jgi:hypothetical protein
VTFTQGSITASQTFSWTILPVPAALSGRDTQEDDKKLGDL